MCLCDTSLCWFPAVKRREGENEGDGWEDRGDERQDCEFGVSYCTSQGQRRRGRAWEDISSRCNVRCLSPPAVIHNVTTHFFFFFCLFCRYRLRKHCCSFCYVSVSNPIPTQSSRRCCILKWLKRNSSSPWLVGWKENICVFMSALSVRHLQSGVAVYWINLPLHHIVLHRGYFTPACRKHGAMRQKGFFPLTGISTWNSAQEGSSLCSPASLSAIPFLFSYLCHSESPCWSGKSEVIGFWIKESEPGWK